MNALVSDRNQRSRSPRYLLAIELNMKPLILSAVILFSLNTWAGPKEDAAAFHDKLEYGKALQIIRPLAANGVAWAQGRLGYMYHISLGVKQDYKEALKWYKLAAIQGDVTGQRGLGALYQSGDAVVQDYVESIKWYKLAAAQGDETAQANLGDMYLSGKGEAQDFVRAHMWYNIAAINSYPYPARQRDEIAKKMDYSQITKAQRLARECQDRKFKDC